MRGSVRIGHGIAVPAVFAVPAQDLRGRRAPVPALPPSFMEGEREREREDQLWTTSPRHLRERQTSFGMCTIGSYVWTVERETR